jgi:transposase
MQKFIYFIGIDISKGTLDFSVVKNGEQVFHVKTTNDLNGIEVFLTHLKTMADFDLSQCVFCMENTGIYNHFILCSLDTIKANICLQSPLQIKYSSGLQRGKNDKIDAKRIAFYAYQKRDILKLWQPQRPI